MAKKSTESTAPYQKKFSADVSVAEGDRAVVAKISTVAVDREGDVLIPTGCNTKDFEKNPVVFFGHEYYSLPVGKCVSIKRDEKHLIAKTVFAERPENHPADQEWFPDTLLSLYQQGVLKGFSVGFDAIEPPRMANDGDRKKYGASARRIFSKWNLLEYSVAPIPMNQEAVATAVAKGLIRQPLADALGFSGPVKQKMRFEVPVSHSLKAAETLSREIDRERQKSRGRIYLV